MKYFEYDKLSGKIISELTSSGEPEVPEGIALLEVSDDEEIEVSKYIIKSGILQRKYETNAELEERERLRRENAENVRLRISSMLNEYVIAQLEDDDEALKRLKAEYRRLKVYL